MPHTTKVIGSALAALALTVASGMSAGSPVHAEPAGGSLCPEFTGRGSTPGLLISFTAQTYGHSGTFNPGNAKNPAPPFVASVCNPTEQPQPPSGGEPPPPPPPPPDQP